MALALSIAIPSIVSQLELSVSAVHAANPPGRDRAAILYFRLSDPKLGCQLAVALF